MNSRKQSQRTKPCRTTAVEVRPRLAAVTQGLNSVHSNNKGLSASKFGKAKRVEMTTNDLRAFGHALLAEKAPAPNASLVNAMRQAKAWL